MGAKAARRLHRMPGGSTTPPRDMGVMHRLVPNYLLLNLLTVSWQRSEGDDFVALWAMTNRVTGFLSS